MKLSVYIAASLDGFIAREDGALDWLPGADGGGGGEDFGFQEFFDSVDTLVMGRNTYEMVLSFRKWPYGEKRVFVITSKGVEIPDHLKGKVEVSSSSPAELIEELSESGVKHVYVDGGKTIQGFLRAGLINEINLTTVPVLIGKGIRLFGDLDHDLKLRLIESIAFNNGFVQSRYVLPK